MHSRTPVGLLRPGIIKDNSDAGEITRMSKKRVQTGKFSDYVPLLIEGFSYSWTNNALSLCISFILVHEALMLKK